MDFKKIEKLMELMGQYGMSEVKVKSKDSGEEISLCKYHPQPIIATQTQIPVGQHRDVTPANNAVFSTPVSQSPAISSSAMNVFEQSEPKENIASAPQKRADARKTIRSPFVGTFYVAPQPGADPFVTVNQRVKKGDILCIVEAMKLMKEIEAEFSGTIREILVENEQPVEFDQPLFIME